LTAQPERPGEASRSQDSTAQAASLTAGRIGRAHALDGSFYVTRPEARLLTLGATVSVDGREAEIVRRSGTEKRPILRLEGVDSREAVEALRGRELTVARKDAPALAEGEWWAHELEGCAVVDGEHRLGTVSRMLVLPSCEALEVAVEGGGGPVIVPLVKDAVRSVEPQRGLIEVNLDFLGLARQPSRTHDPSEPGERGESS
jgi:16S rRNA processing protein RimM